MKNRNIDLETPYSASSDGGRNGPRFSPDVQEVRS